MIEVKSRVNVQLYQVNTHTCASARAIQEIMPVSCVLILSMEIIQRLAWDNPILHDCCCPIYTRLTRHLLQTTDKTIRHYICIYTLSNVILLHRTRLIQLHELFSSCHKAGAALFIIKIYVVQIQLHFPNSTFGNVRIPALVIYCLAHPQYR